MKKFYFLIVVILAFFVSLSYAGLWDTIDKVIEDVSPETEQKALDTRTVSTGLKEALSVGVDKAVKKVSQRDGYLGNPKIRIPIPGKIKTITDALETFGFKEEVNSFYQSMNRAAESAAPEAASIFAGAIKEMTFDDAQKILNGSNTAATEFFKDKTSEKLYQAFHPIISSKMQEVGVTRLYKDIMSKYTSIPFATSLAQGESLDLDHYITNKALKGLFYMVGQEEMKIRSDPAARVTDILKTVFGK